MARRSDPGTVRTARRWPRPERVRPPRTRLLSPWWVDCQAAMDAAVAFHTAGCAVLVCAAVPRPRVIVEEGAS